MDVKQNIFYAFTTYEVDLEAAKQPCFTIVDNSNNKMCIYIYICECKKA